MSAIQLVHNLFEQQKELTPDLLAVVCGGSSITYTELDHRANILSRAILAHSAESAIIGISTTRSIDMVVGVVAILKSGKAYLPLNPANPPAYLQNIIEDAEVDICISGKQELELFQGLGIAALSIDSIIISSQTVQQAPGKQLAYVAYATGASGNAQAVVMGNDACVHLINWQEDISIAGISTKTLQIAPLDVDTSFLEIFSTLTTGGTLYLAEDKLLPEPAHLLDYVSEQGINRLFPYPALLQLISEAATTMEQPPGRVAEVIVVGGIINISAEIATFINLLPGANLFHYWGVPGCPVIGYHNYSGIDGIVPGVSRILQPVPYVTTHILDAHLNEAEVGNVYISGPALAEGQPANDEPIMNWSGSTAMPMRIFKTGFTGRKLASGQVELIQDNGAITSLLGHTIAPSAVAQLLKQAENVEAATAAVIGLPGKQKMVAYVVATNNIEDATALRNSLAEHLPQYMQPQAFEWLKALPATVDGQPNKETLQKLVLKRPELDTLYKVPLNNIERKVCQLVSAALGIDKVGVDDNLWELGCTSIVLIQLARRLSTEYAVDVPFSLFFKAQNVAGVVAFISAADGKMPQKAAPIATLEEYPMTEQMPDTDSDGGEDFIPEGRTMELVPAEIINVSSEDIPLTPTQRDFVSQLVRNYQAKTSESKLQSRIPQLDAWEGANSAITAMSYPIVADRAKGCQLWDIDGNEYLDIRWNSLFGHQPDFVIDALQTQLKWSDLSGRQQKLATSVAQLVGEITRTDSAIVCGTATDALLTAIHIARIATAKLPIVVIAGTMAAEVLQGMADVSIVTQDTIDASAHISALLKRAAAIIAAPSNPTTSEEQADFLRTLRNLSNEAGVVLIFDAARGGLPTNTPVDGAVPDMTIYGDVIAAGLPMGIVAVNKPWMTGLGDKGDTVLQQLQPDYKNLNPLALNAAHAVLQHTLNGGAALQAQLTDLTTSFAATINQYCSEQRLPFSVMHNGNAWKLVASDAASALLGLLFNLLLEKGIYINATDDCYFTAAFTNDHVASLFSKFKLCIAELATGGFIELINNDEIIEELRETPEVQDEIIEPVPIEEPLAVKAPQLPEVPFIGPTDDEAPLLYSTDVALSVAISTIAHEFADHIAVRTSTQHHTYKYINEKSNQFATLLLIGGIKPGNVVAVALDRSVEMVITLLAIMKAGGTFLILDTDMPVKRAEYILHDASAKVLLTDKKHDGSYKSDVKQILLEEAWVKLPRYTTDDVQVKITGNDGAYVTYIQGIEGNPQGIIVEHHSLVNLLFYAQHALDILPGEKVLAASLLAADSFVFDVFLPLISGAEVFLANSLAIKNAKALLDILENEQIAVALASREMWQKMLNAGLPGHLPLKALCAGDGLSREISARLLEKCSFVYLLYCSPEATVFSAVLQMKPGINPNLVGRPIVNSQLYVLGEHMEKLAPGETGHVYVSGSSVARGYVGTGIVDDRFIDNPFIDNGSAKIFRTGDVGKLTKGNIVELLQRDDRQVIIEGYSVNLDGVGAVISGFENAGQAGVIYKDDTLFCYVARMGNGTAQDIAGWKIQAQLSLPVYMQPTEYIVLAEMPLTASGSVDFVALQSIKQEIKQDNFIAPGNETEQLIAGIWAEILGLEKVSATDNFFLLGGSAEQVGQMAKMLEKATRKIVSITTINGSPTVEALALALKGGNAIPATGSIVNLKPSGTRMPLYIVHGEDISITEFTAVAKHMDQDQPVFGFQPRRLEEGGSTPPTMEQIATDYIQQMLKHNQGGAVALAGYSYGGYIAYEMARQLADLGKPVEMLAMFDVYAYTKEELGPNAEKQKGGLPKAMFLLNSLIKQPLETIDYQSGSAKDKLAGLFSGQRKDSDKLHEQYENACRKYTLQPYNGIIDLFRVQKRLYFLTDMKFLGWRPFAKKGIRVHEIPGDHKSYIEVPNNKDFAKILQNSLDSIVPGKK